MHLIPVFDLDDTLYNESEFLTGGFEAVSVYLSQRSEFTSDEILGELLRNLELKGRGKVFNDTLRNLQIRGADIRKLLSVYRQHAPKIQLFPEAEHALQHLKSLNKNTFVLTDGNRFVQRRKFEALGLNSLVSKAFFTRDMGLNFEKPSVRYFELLVRRWGVGFENLLYVGDDPSKDFLGLNMAGATTVRVLTGRFAHSQAQGPNEAKHIIKNLDGLLSKLE